MPTFHPDLAVARFIPKYSMSPRMVRLMRRPAPRTTESPDGVRVRSVDVPGNGAAGASVRLYEPIHRGLLRRRCCGSTAADS